MIIESKADNYVTTIKNSEGEVILHLEIEKYDLSINLPELLKSGVDLNQLVFNMVSGNEPL